MSQPDSFTWVIPGVLAAMAKPDNPRTVLEFFKDEGIGAIVTLMERPLNKALIEEFGFEYHHIPISDFSAPSADQISEFVEAVEDARRSGQKIVVHCLAGQGRTGTMLACYLVSQGRSSTEAIGEIRELRPGSIETNAQERAVYQYARDLRMNSE